MIGKRGDGREMAADRITHRTFPSEAGVDAGASPENVIEVWQVNTTRIDRSLQKSLLDQSEQVRAAKIQNLQMRDQYICTRIFSRLILGDWLDIDPQKIAFSYDTGKPICLNQGAPNFSLSKRENWIAMAVSAEPIGIDLERIDPQAADRHVIEELFSSAERDLLAKLKEPAATLAYFFMWTQKEACSKATGRGAELDFAKIQTSPEGGLVTIISDTSSHDDLYGHALSGPKDHVLTVVTSLEAPDIRHSDAKLKAK